MDPALIPKTDLSTDPVTTPSMILPGAPGGGGTSPTSTVDTSPTQAASDPSSVAAINNFNAQFETNQAGTASTPQTTNMEGYTADQLTIIKNRAQQLQDQVNKLASQDSTAADGIVSTDEKVVVSEQDALNDLNAKISVPSDESLNVLNNEIDRIQRDLQFEIASINKTFDVLKTDTQTAQKSETGQTSMGIAQAGGYLGFSGSGQGVMLNLAKSHRDELMKLASKRQAAIAEAKRAAADKRYDLVRLKVDEIGRIDQETYNREQDYFDNKLKLQNEETSRAQTLKVQTDISKAIAGGATSAQDIFTALQGSATIEEINNFLQGITPPEREGFTFTPSQNAALLGSGMSIDDIRAISEYVTENGYDENLKSVLTPLQRKTLDKVFGTAVGVAGGGGYTDFTDQEKRKLEQAGLLNAPRQDQLDFLYGGKNAGDLPFESIYTGQILEGATTLDSLPFDIRNDVREELLNLGFGSSVVPAFYRDYIENESLQTLSADELQKSWNTYRLTALGEYRPEETGGGQSWLEKALEAWNGPS